MLVQARHNSHRSKPESLNTSFKFYEYGIPAFIEKQLESLYECHMSTIIRFSQYYKLDDASVYTSYTGARLASAIVFQKSDDHIVVYNEQVYIPTQEIDRFIGAIYERYPDVSQIHFYALDLGQQKIGFPNQKLACLEKIELTLPKSTSNYLSMLSKNFSAQIRRAERMIARDMPNACFNFKLGIDIKREDLESIVELSRARMAAKNQTCYHTDDTTSKLFELVKRYGVVGIFSVDETIYGGVVLLKIGSTYLLQIIAHHPNYDIYKLGTICVVNGILYAINNNATTFNFGWGSFEYKYKLLGQRKTLYQLFVYKTEMYMILDAPMLCRRKIFNLQRSLRLSLAGYDPNQKKIIALMRRCSKFFRSIKFRVVP